MTAYRIEDKDLPVTQDCLETLVKCGELCNALDKMMKKAHSLFVETGVTTDERTSVRFQGHVSGSVFAFIGIKQQIGFMAKTLEEAL